MTQKFTQAYLDALFSKPELMKLVEIAGYFGGAEEYRSDEPDFGLPRPVFVFQESLTWFSQTIRSGMWTYYEATPRARQQAMLRALECEAPPDYAATYSLGRRRGRTTQNTKSSTHGSRVARRIAISGSGAWRINTDLYLNEFAARSVGAD